MVLALVGCTHAAAPGTTLALRPACGATERWDGTRCLARGDAPQKLAVGTAALAELKVDEAKAALDQVEKAGPLDHSTNVTMWEQRGIAAAYVDDEAGATSAFDMLLALDPAHFLSYELSPKATLVFEKALKVAKAHPAPAVDVSWPRGGKVGEAVPIAVDVLADPKKFLARATLFVRTRGDTAWRAADLSLKGVRERRVVLPAVEADKPVSLEVYLLAYDPRGNEVLTWADPARPREIALRYEPPPPWYRTWWGLTTLGVVGAGIVGGIVYEVTLAPPDKISGSSVVH